MEKNAEFMKVMQTCKAKTSESKGFDLPSFLLKGMQRLLKYHPLLQQILKRTEETNLVQIQQLTDAMQLVEEHGEFCLFCLVSVIFIEFIFRTALMDSFILLTSMRHCIVPLAILVVEEVTPLQYKWRRVVLI